jgi:hypothetical protein
VFSFDLVSKDIENIKPAPAFPDWDIVEHENDQEGFSLTYARRAALPAGVLEQTWDVTYYMSGGGEICVMGTEALGQSNESRFFALDDVQAAWEETRRRMLAAFDADPDLAAEFSVPLEDEPEDELLRRAWAGDFASHSVEPGAR